MNQKNDHNRPGQPEKSVEVGSYLLRFRANYPNLQDSLKNMAKNTGKSLNDYLLKVLNNHIQIQNPINKKGAFILEQNFESFFQYIDLKIYSFEGDLQLIKHTKSQSLQNFIETNYPNSLEKKVIYLKLIHNHIKAEKELLLFILMINNFEQNNEELKIYNYIDFYIEKYGIGQYINREDLSLKIIQDFYQKWYLQLDLYNIFEDKSDFNINVDALENFLFTQLFPDLKSIPLFEKERYNKLKKKWEGVLNLYPYTEFKYKKTFNLKNIENYLDFLKSMKKHLEFCYGLDVIDNEKLKKEAINNLKEFADIKKYESFNKTIKIVMNLNEEYNKEIGLYLFNNSSYQIPSQIKKNDFLSCFNSCFNNLFYGEIPIFKNSYYPLMKYLRKKTEIESYFFSPYIIQDLLRLTDFYNYLKEKQGLQNFLQALWKDFIPHMNFEE